MERTKTRRQIYDQYFRILHQLTPDFKWADEQAKPRADRIREVLYRYSDNMEKVPEIARYFGTNHMLNDGVEPKDPCKAANEVPVPRSVYMGLKRIRRKSMSDIFKQAEELKFYIYHYVHNHERYCLIERIEMHYRNNIAKSLGYHGLSYFTDCGSKTKPGTYERMDFDRDYQLKVDREVYAAKFDWWWATEWRTTSGMLDVKSALWHEGIDICKGCPFVGDSDNCGLDHACGLCHCREQIIKHAPVAIQTIYEARRQDKWSINHKWNYGPIDYLYERVSSRVFEKWVHKVTDAETYFVWEMCKFDIRIDADYLVCAMRRTFPDVSFGTVCEWIRKHKEPHQYDDGISISLVPEEYRQKYNV